MRRNKNLPIRPIADRVLDIGEHKIISLGSSCWSRTLPERFHVFDFKKDRDVRMPFDGCTTPYHALCKILESDFKCMYDGLKVAKNPLHLNTDVPCYYNHEKNTNLDDFKIQMNKRIYQFQTEIKNATLTNNRILFFLTQFIHHVTTEPIYPTKLISILNKKYPNLNYKVLCIDCQIYDTNLESVDTEFYKYVNVPRPNHNYDLFKDKERRHGKKFEKNALNVLLSFISEFTNQEYDAEKVFLNRAWDVY